jgi:hypothetical protein
MNRSTHHPACRDVDALLAECEVRRQRRSGPGGQHRNKVETGVFIRHLGSGIEAGATEQRGQEANRRVAIDRLRMKLAIGVRSPVADDRAPSAAWQKRLVGTRIQCSARHEDYPALVAEALDFLAAASWDVAAAARRLECSGSQLVKLLKKEPAAMAKLNSERRSVGLTPLK